MPHTITIKNRRTNAVIFKHEVSDEVHASGFGVRHALEAATMNGADLRGADLRGANLLDANLRDADLRGANLLDANLRDADLRGANLLDANLLDANLRGADLLDANLLDANLRDADLRGANLRGADLRGADLRDANLRGANLRGAKDAELAIAKTRILADGDLIGWKKCQSGVIVKLSIPSAARRSHAFGRKCRAEFADVMEVIGAAVGISAYDDKTQYIAGQRVKADVWSEDWQEECAGGIHFFITRLEAETY